MVEWSEGVMKNDRCDMFKVLGVGTRVRIIELLKSRGPLGTKTIAAHLGVTPAAVSQHLKVLKHAGLVRGQRRGYFIPYKVDEKGLENCCERLIDVCTCECDPPVRIMVRRRHGSKLESLKQYERRLQQELKRVRDEIAKLDSQKG
jgi:DNA-binding transcriptional ArsR family regulator